MSAPKVDFPYGTGGGGGGGVSGSGTAGTVPVWSGSTALGDSPLTVSGTAVTGSGPIRATGTSATTPAFTGSDTDTGLYFPAVGNQLRLSTAGTLAIAIDASQNVGVNAASPAGKLHVALGTGFSPGAPWTSSTAVFGGTGVNAGALGVAYDGTNGASLISIEPTVGWKTLSYHALDHRWNVAGSGEFMRLSSGGLLSVGTTSATAGRALTTVADLDVYGVRVGRGAGANSESVAVGQFALNSNTGGSGNAAVGAEALSSNLTGSESSAVGKYALRYATGSRNTGIGAGAGNNVASGTDNVCVGWYATVSASANNNSIVIGSNLVGNGSNTVTIGNSSITDNYFNGVIRLGNAAQGVRLPSTPTNSNANTLDCYEEGTWTPEDRSGAGLTFQNVAGTYTRIGRTVIAQATLTYPATTSTAHAQISLPIALPSNNTNYGGATIGYMSGGTVNNIVALIATGNPASSTSNIKFSNYNGFGNVQNSNFSGVLIILTAVYNIA